MQDVCKSTGTAMVTRLKSGRHLNNARGLSPPPFSHQNSPPPEATSLHASNTTYPLSFPLSGGIFEIINKTRGLPHTVIIKRLGVATISDPKLVSWCNVWKHDTI